MCIYIYIYICIYILCLFTGQAGDFTSVGRGRARDTSTCSCKRDPCNTSIVPHYRMLTNKLPIPYTTQRGWCREVVVSILVQSQSPKSLPGGGGV